MIIAIDGPSASGKGTVAKALAKELGYHYLDTGSLYRMVGLSVMKTGRDPVEVAATLKPSEFNDSDLRGEEVGSYASKVAALPEVRKALLKFQRDFSARKPGAVLDGRDIGTVVCPEADFKFFITASVEARTKRRALEEGANLHQIRSEIEARDKRDSERATAPLKPAADAVVIDTSDMTPQEAVAQVLRRIQ